MCGFGTSGDQRRNRGKLHRAFWFVPMGLEWM
jgi:hypothetical protein